MMDLGGCVPRSVAGSLSVLLSLGQCGNHEGQPTQELKIFIYLYTFYDNSLPFTAFLQINL